MSRPKITVVGKLRYSESDGLKFRYQQYYLPDLDAEVSSEIAQRGSYDLQLRWAWGDVFDRTVCERQCPGLTRPVEPSPARNLYDRNRP
jgi:hypothetical protein